jgi:nicotinate dehydrogenase subunit A
VNAMQRESFTLRVNGAQHTVEADRWTTLLDILRNDLTLKGTRFGCGEEQCGACNVIVDGYAVASCATPIWGAADKTITTVEGLGSAGTPHALQQAFLQEQAAQCGYCTSGMLVSAAALLMRVAQPTEDEVRKALDRNLCRCGVHNRIVRAVLRAAGQAAAA